MKTVIERKNSKGQDLKVTIEMLESPCGGDDDDDDDGLYPYVAVYVDGERKGHGEANAWHPSQRPAEMKHLTHIIAAILPVTKDEYELVAAALKAERDPIIDAMIEHDRRNTRCDRCGAHVDTDSAYHQEEWARLGVSKVKVRAYYCDPCARLLRAIGAGERTAMQERAARVPSYEPETKADF